MDDDWGDNPATWPDAVTDYRAAWGDPHAQDETERRNREERP